MKANVFLERWKPTYFNMWVFHWSNNGIVVQFMLQMNLVPALSDSTLQ